MAGNVGVSAVAGIGGLSNGATRNAKADQLQPVPRHNLNKETESNEDTEPRHCTNLLLWRVVLSTLILNSSALEMPSQIEFLNQEMNLQFEFLSQGICPPFSIHHIEQDYCRL